VLTFPDITAELRAAMPGLRGTLEANAPMAPLSWFRTGGAAQALFAPVDADDLALFLAQAPADVPRMVVGLGSNLLVRDGGVPGVVICLGKGFTAVKVEQGHRIRAGAGAPDVKVASTAAKAGIAGLAFLRGIPGSVGGALRMNGGAYGGETKDVLVRAEGLTRQGRPVVFDNAAMGFAYRTCAVAGDVIFTSALFQGQPGDPLAIAAEMNGITQARSSTQPVNTRTGGSTFRNPADPKAGGRKAWQLIDAAGCRGLRRGAAQVSELHCNFLINHGGATSADIEALGEDVRRRVREASGVELTWEIRRMGGT